VAAVLGELAVPGVLVQLGWMDGMVFNGGPVIMLLILDCFSINLSKLLVQALSIREKYMKVSRQFFPSACDRYLRQVDGKTVKDQEHDDRATIEGKY
jgi:hypothetical protein